MNAVDASLHRTAPLAAAPQDDLRQDWTRAEIRALFDLPFPELIFRAQSVHRLRFDPAKVQLSTLMSIKTGGCPEDCAYCPQSAHHDTGLKASKLVDVEAVMQAAREAKASGSTRFCMGAAWRSPKDRDMDDLCELVEGVKAMGMETCMTLGMLTAPQAGRLKVAGLEYYNHNLVQVAGTPLEGAGRVHPLDFVRTIAVARITMPASMVRLSAGREDMTDEMQALCFIAGANSIFAGDRLLTTPNPGEDRDGALFSRLGMTTDGAAGQR